jgi:hypothetical protein
MKMMSSCEILEALYENHFQHHEHKLEAGCHIQEKFQKIVAPPLAEDGTDQNVVDESHFPSLECYEDIRQYFQQDKVLQSYLSSSKNDLTIQILSDLDRDEGSLHTIHFLNPFFKNKYAKNRFFNLCFKKEFIKVIFMKLHAQGF